VNKVDAADPESLRRLRRELPDAVFVSAATGEGIDALRAAVQERLPRPARELRVRLPYDQGALVSRAHREGEVLDERHTADGTLLHVRVSAGLGAALAPYVDA
jgi:GTP-binding protein HflX